MIIQLLGLVGSAFAIAGVLLNNRMRIECFYLWLVSNSLCACVHAYTGLWTLVIRDVVFLMLAVQGLRHWRANKKSECRHWRANKKSE